MAGAVEFAIRATALGIPYPPGYRTNMSVAPHLVGLVYQ